MFLYKNIADYIAAIRAELVHSCWHYTEEQADELINRPERMQWIKDAFAKQEPVGDLAVEVGYCCG